MRHDAVGPDNCPVAYPYPGQDGGGSAAEFGDDGQGDSSPDGVCRLLLSQPAFQAALRRHSAAVQAEKAGGSGAYCF